MIREWLLRRAEAIMASRPPDFEIGPPGDRYLLRWYLTPWSRYERGSKPKNWLDALTRKLPNAYLHRFRHDDEDRALHNHPWASCSVMLKSGYYEVMKLPTARPEEGDVKVFRPEGSVTFRRASAFHRVVLLRSYVGERSVPRFEPVAVEAITLFLTGFVVQGWGFACPQGFRPWQEFVSSRDKGSVGRGCED